MSFLAEEKFVKNWLLPHLVQCWNKSSSVSPQHDRQYFLQFDLFSCIRKSLKNIVSVCITNHPKFNIQNWIPDFAVFWGRYCIKGHREQHRKGCSLVVTLAWGKNAFNMAFFHSSLIAANLSVLLCSVQVVLSSNRIYRKTI